MNKILFHTLRLLGAITCYIVAFNLMNLDFWLEIGIAALFLCGSVIQNLERDDE